MEANVPVTLDELVSNVMNQANSSSSAAQGQPSNAGPNGESVGAQEVNERLPPVQRRTSSALALNGTPPPRRANSDMTTSPYSPDGGYADDGAANGTSSTMWSSAVGRATTGKSGRVIERIQADNDRLRRELKLETARREEEQRRGDSARSQVENLEATNANLTHLNEQYQQLVTRAWAKIDDLRNDYGMERTRRVEAEELQDEAAREHERIMSDLNAKLQAETERAAHAHHQYQTLSTSWHEKEDGYQEQIDKLKATLDEVRVDYSIFEDQNRRKLKKLETTVDEQRKEIEKMRAAKDGVSRELESYKRESDEVLENIKKRARRNEEAHEEALAKMNSVKGEMKHVMNVKRFVRDAQGGVEEEAKEDKEGDKKEAGE